MIANLVRQMAEASIRNTSAIASWTRTGFSGLAHGGMVGFGIYAEELSTGREYGAGLAAIRGVGYATPYVGVAMMLYDVGKTIGDTAYSYQQAKRRSSFTHGFQDPFGTASTMRQRSQHNLNRGRASLGSEAYLYHESLLFH